MCCEVPVVVNSFHLLMMLSCGVEWSVTVGRDDAYICMAPMQSLLVSGSHRQPVFVVVSLPAPHIDAWMRYWLREHVHIKGIDDSLWYVYMYVMAVGPPCRFFFFFLCVCGSFVGIPLCSSSPVLICDIAQGILVFTSDCVRFCSSPNGFPRSTQRCRYIKCNRG